MLLCAGMIFSGAGLIAGDDKSCIINDKCPVECCKEDPCWCEIFDKSTLYKNEENCLIQSVQLVGRYHGQYQSSSLEHSSGRSLGTQYWEHRRLRLGTRVQFLNDFTFFNNWNLGNDNNDGARIAGDFWGSIYEMYIKWDPSDSDIGLWVSVGKQEQKITREFSTSSKKILTFERSQITNEVADTAAWGVETGFEALGIEHAFGLWLGGYDNDADGRGPRAPGFDGARGGASYRGAYGITEATDLHFDYFYTNNSDGTRNPRGRADEDALPNYNHIFALGTESSWDIGCCDRKYGLVTDLIWGIDREASGGNSLGIAGGNNATLAGQDTFGIVILPHYDLTERLELVGKYAYASNTVLQRGQRRAFDHNGVGRPNLEDVHTFYAGFNYRLCGDNFKLMGGYEYLTADLHENAGSTDLGDLSGDTWMLGVRTYW